MSRHRGDAAGRETAAVVVATALVATTTGLAAGSGPSADTVSQYRIKCQSCHLPDGKGSLPPMDFTDGEWKHGRSQAEVVKVISDGVPGTSMLAFKGQLTRAQIEALARYVRAFEAKAKTEAPSAKATGDR